MANPFVMEIEGKEFRAVAFCLGQDRDGGRWRVMLKAEDGRVVESDRSFATEREAYEFGMGWVKERGGELAQ